MRVARDAAQRLGMRAVVTGARMSLVIVDGSDADAIEQRRAGAAPPASWSPSRPRPSTAWRARRRRRGGRADLRAKGRPTDHPLIVHVADRDAALRASPPRCRRCAERLVAAFWPGPLTVIVPRARRRRRRPPPAARRRSACAARRIRSRTRCCARCARAGRRRHRPRRAPTASAASARPPRRTCATSSATTLLVLDGGACAVGIESAIVDCQRGVPVLLRPGVLDARRSSSSVLASRCATPMSHSRRAPGTLESHYAPRAKLRLMASDELQAALQVLPATRQGLAVYSRTAPRRHPLVRVMPDDPEGGGAGTVRGAARIRRPGRAS